MSKEEYYEYPTFFGGCEYGIIRYKYDSYRVTREAYELVKHCTNMKWMAEATEMVAFEKIQNGEFEEYFGKIE